MKYLLILLLFVACNKQECEEKIVNKELENEWTAGKDGQLMVHSNSCAYIVEVNDRVVFSGWERYKYVEVKKNDTYRVKRWSELVEQGDTFVLVTDTGYIEFTYRNYCNE